MDSPFELGSPRARALLGQALSADPPRLDLAALSVAALEAPELDLASATARLDALARRVEARSRPLSPPLESVQALCRVLAEEEGFRGDPEPSFAPENSFLDRVLERRKGAPISLSIVYLEVARRAGLSMYGVSFPGHFVIAMDTREGKLVVDPFHGGRLMTAEGCEELLRELAPQVKFTPGMITPAPVRAIAYRLMASLKRVYLDQGDGERALRVVDLMLAVTPDHPGELRARAAILSALGAYRAALADVERCLELSPEAPDHQSLLLTAQALRERVERLN